MKTALVIILVVICFGSALAYAGLTICLCMISGWESRKEEAKNEVREDGNAGRDH